MGLLFFWLRQVLAVARGIFVEACGIFHGGARASPYLWHAGFLSLVAARGLRGAWAL